MKSANDNNFGELISKEKITLVDFYAQWCVPCQMQSKVLEKIETSRENDFEIVKVNVDECPELASKFEITSIPTLVILKNGKLVKKSVGFSDETELLDMISGAML